MPKPSDRRLRNAIIRILHGESDVQTEAAALNISKRTLQRHLAAWREVGGASEVSPDVSPDPVSPVDTPPGPGASGGPNQALEAALEAAGERREGGSGGPGGAPGAPTGPEIGQAREDMAKFCIEAIGQVKAGTGSMIVMGRYSPPLSLDDAAVQKLLGLSVFAQGVIRTNAERLYPFLVKMMSGPYQLAGALVAEALMLFVGLQGLASSRGWVEPAKKEKREAEAKKPWVQTWPPASAAASAPPVPPEGVRTIDASNGPFGQVKDAPPASAAA